MAACDKSKILRGLAFGMTVRYTTCIHETFSPQHHRRLPPDPCCHGSTAWVPVILIAASAVHSWRRGDPYLLLCMSLRKEAVVEYMIDCLGYSQDDINDMDEDLTVDDLLDTMSESERSECMLYAVGA